MGDEPLQLDLSKAENALERGDYGQCLAMLDPLATSHPVSDPEGSRIRLLMVTAWMGQGREQEAIATCRLLSRAGDPDRRQQARQLLAILEAPSLERPERWSMRLPEMKLNATGSAAPVQARRRRSRRPTPPPPPPTGPTQGPSPGFALLVAAVLLGLTLLLSGCVRIEADLSSPSPGRVQLSWQIESSTDHLLPWQRRLETDLAQQHPELTIRHPGAGQQRIDTPPMPPPEMNQLLADITTIAGGNAGVNLKPPTIQLEERNWMVGVDQRLSLQLDLSDLPEIPGVDLSLGLNQKVPKHPLIRGEELNVALRRWHWSPLGLGSGVITVLLVLSLLLQGIRRQLGFGFPELPS